MIMNYVGFLDREGKFRGSESYMIHSLLPKYKLRNY